MIEDEERRWRELDASIGETLVEMNAGGGIDFGEAYEALLADLATVDDHARPYVHPSHHRLVSGS
ncbi:hypothetical protein [Sphingomonas mollis]|uniref:Uncharacterized protein n=1 Tax=Sphingomonas mollis TaxID=2795726 RepID=A0ABS0XTB0_9SPHN|nr:hypothetical protein [Sphingomonas sp. BT553]MBJ6123263.1 hypothetical protein [Sphingomonas sp. BT553]